MNIANSLLSTLEVRSWEWANLICVGWWVCTHDVMNTARNRIVMHSRIQVHVDTHTADVLKIMHGKLNPVKYIHPNYCRILSTISSLSCFIQVTVIVDA